MSGIFRRSAPAALALALAATACVRATGGTPADPPNIVVILGDDLGWSDLGVYGSSFHQTPSLDRMAREGLRFIHGYAASPVCSPTRSSLLTGRYPARIGQTDWIPGFGNEPDQRLLQVEDLDHLPLEEITVAELLRKAGYATGHIGKWHLGGDGHLPTDQGFDLNIAGGHRGSPPGYFYPYPGLPGLESGQEGEYLTDRLGEEAVRFIGEHSDQPFFLYLSHYAPHTPIQGKAELVEKYRTRVDTMETRDGPTFGAAEGLRTRRLQDGPIYAAMVESLDETVGRVLEALSDNDIDDRTIVIFLSDNGGLSVLPLHRNPPPTSNRPLRAGKGWLYEGGIRVPWIVRWPGTIRPGITSDVPVSTVDLFPTLLEIAGVPPPAGMAIDGVSQLPLLRGGSELKRDALYWHYPHYHNSGAPPGGAIRSANYKLIEWYESGDIELYDLLADPAEMTNLAGEEPRVAKSLRAELARWRHSVGAQMPATNPLYRSEDPVRPRSGNEHAAIGNLSNQEESHP